MKIQPARIAGLIVAAGASRRMGFDKMTAPLAGRPLVTWSLAAFEACEDIGPCALVCAEARLAEFTALAAPYKKFQSVVAGGNERAESVLNGLQALGSRGLALIAVHDAARPLVTPAMISRVVAVAEEWGAAAAAEPVGDSLHRATAAGHLAETVSREGLWAMQTPQVAGLQALREALEAAKASKRVVTDEISALIQAGRRPRTVFHGNLNLKVTFPRDLALAEAVLLSQKDTGTTRD
ncbi:MAG: 2-C-methyl-D-erythritol 4-phosphate cytidylyltransferase [Terrimicrobiaceae bacterium]|nr:2-C-methyl-D-erythritol 4-phosphate cytidylyltransferase [Terrimicrobiaceae bacterium]